MTCRFPSLENKRIPHRADGRLATHQTVTSIMGAFMSVLVFLRLNVCEGNVEGSQIVFISASDESDSWRPLLNGSTGVSPRSTESLQPARPPGTTHHTTESSFTLMKKHIIECQSLFWHWYWVNRKNYNYVSNECDFG